MSLTELKSKFELENIVDHFVYQLRDHLILETIQFGLEMQHLTSNSFYYNNYS